jgi:hypothetical protein
MEPAIDVPAAAQVRVPAETGLLARFVPGEVVGGFDAGGYRTFEEKLEWLDAQTRPRGLRVLGGQSRPASRSSEVTGAPLAGVGSRPGRGRRERGLHPGCTSA